MKAFVRFALILVLGITAIVVYRSRFVLASGSASTAAIEHHQRALRTIPLNIRDGELKGESISTRDGVVDFSGAEFYASSSYTDRLGQRYRLWVGGALNLDGYFHRPDGCLAYRGWEIVESGDIPFDAFGASNSSPTMRRMLWKKGSERMFVFYWFQQRKHVTADEWGTNYFLFRNLMSLQSPSAVYMVCTYVPLIGDREVVEQRARAFLRNVGPHIERAVLQGEQS